MSGTIIGSVSIITSPALDLGYGISAINDGLRLGSATRSPRPSKVWLVGRRNWDRGPRTFTWCATEDEARRLADFIGGDWMIPVTIPEGW